MKNNQNSSFSEDPGAISENRRHPRFSVDVVVNYADNAIAHTKDMSEGGICLICDRSFAEGEMLHLSLRIPGEESSIASFCKVMWSRQATEHLSETGLSFWNITEEDRNRIAEFLKTGHA